MYLKVFEEAFSYLPGKRAASGEIETWTSSWYFVPSMIYRSPEATSLEVGVHDMRHIQPPQNFTEKHVVALASHRHSLRVGSDIRQPS